MLLTNTMQRTKHWIAAIILGSCLLLTADLTAQFELPQGATFYDMTDSFMLHLPPDTSEGGLRNRLRRDGMTWGPRLAPDGRMSKATQAITNYSTNFNQSLGRNSQVHTWDPSWLELGPVKRPIGSYTGGGMGQIHRIAFHPNFNGTSNQTMYAGSHYAGLYRSDNGGQNWYNYHTDRGLPITSVSGIGVSNQRVFVCTGNGDHGYANYGAAAFYNPLGPGRMNDANPIHTQGVYVLNSGSTIWQGINGATILIDGTPATDLLQVFAEGGTMRDLVLHPTNDNIIFIATSKGIFKTTNRGQSWQQVLVGASNGMGAYWEDTEWRSVQFHPSNPNIVYASGTQIYESLDGGSTWQALTGSASSGASLDFYNNNLVMNNRSLAIPRRIGLAVSPAAPHLLYAFLVASHVHSVVTFNRLTTTWELLYTSTHSGIGFDLTSPDWCGISVAPFDSNRVAIGYTKVEGTKQGAGNFELWSPYLSAGFHPDVHTVAFPPNTDSILYAGTHGGVSKKVISPTVAIGEGWTTLYNGLGVSTIWAFDDWEGDENILATGHQDVGFNYTDSRGEFWRNRIRTGDGYGLGIDDQSGRLFAKGAESYEGMYRILPNFAPLADYYISGSLGVGSFRRVLPDDYSTPSGIGAMVPNTFPVVNHPKNDSLYFGFSELYKRREPGTLIGHLVQEMQIDTIDARLRMGSLDSMGNFIPNTGHPSSYYWYAIDTISISNPNSPYLYKLEANYCPVPPTNGLCIDTTISHVGNHTSHQSVSQELWQLKSNLKNYFSSRWNRRILSINFSEDENTNYTYLTTLGDNEQSLRQGDFYFQDATQHCDTCFIRKTANLPIDQSNTLPDPNPITGIAVDPLNGNRLWASFTGFSPGIKVWYSDDAGDTWSNYDDSQNTLGKLNMPINDIVYQRGTKDRLYIATDIGVYVREDGGDWLRYGDAFPNVRTTELKINYCVGKLRAATFGRGAWEADLLPPEDNINYRSFRLVTNNETWSQDKHLSRDLKIKAGATLTLTNMTLNMPKGGLIVVEQGGSLQVNGATITNLCGETWQGIEVWGNGQIAQTPSSNQGQVSLVDSRVEYAKNALRNWQVGNLQHTGGILQATNTIFYNNWRSAELMRYWTGQNERSYFHGCTFEVDTDYKGFDGDTTGQFLGHVSMWGISNMSIKGCAFKDLRTNKEGDQLQGGSYGIFGLNASPNLTALPLGGSWPPTAYKRNRFEGLERGIELSGTPIWGQVIIDQTDFAGTEQGIILRTVDGARILRDSFFVGSFRTDGPVYNPPVGVVSDFGLGLSSCTAYGVEQNYFVESNGQRNTVGSWLENSGTSYNELRNNDYHGLTGGNLAHGRNQNVTLKHVGLQYLCNENTSNDHDFFVVPNLNTNNADASIALSQGRINQASRNTLSNAIQTFPSQSHFANYSYTQGALNPRVIYYYANSISEVPDTNLIFNVLIQTTPIGPLSYCKNEYQALFTTNKHSGHTIVYFKEQYQQARINYLQTKESYENTSEEDTTTRNNLGSELGALAGQKTTWLNTVVDYYLTDSVVQVDSIAMWLSKQDDLDGQYRLIEFYWSLEQYNEATELLQELPDRFPMDDLQQQNYDQYVLLKDVLRQAFNQDQTLNTLDYATVQTLEEIAQLKVGRASQQAKGILRFFYDKENLDYPYLQLASSARSWQEIEEPKQVLLRATPNPALTWTEISYILPEETETATLLITNTAGQEINRFNITTEDKVYKGMRILDTSTWSGGTYFITLISENKSIASYQLVIQR